jgi:hypothetical protein
MKTFALLIALVGCIAPTDDADPDGDPNLDDKADAASPIAKGAIDWTAPREVAFSDSEGNGVKLVYASFELSGSADVTRISWRSCPSKGGTT